MTTFRNPAQWLLDAFGVGSNKNVTAKTSLENAAFWYGVNKISGNVGTLPLNVMRSVEGGGANKDKNHSAYRLLRKRPNSYQTPFVFKQAMTKDAILWGNGRAAIVGHGRNRELLPLRPDATVAFMVEGEKWHATKPCYDDRYTLFQDMERDPNGVVMLADKDVLHIQGFGDGIEGMSLFAVARTSLGIGLGADERSLKQMTKGFAGKVMLEAPAESQMFRDSKKAAEFLENFKKLHGADGANEEIGLLIGGIKANVMAMSNKDAEFIEQRKFQRQEAALWLMLESILGDDTSVSYNSEEQKQLAYLKNCLSNWLTRWEQECEYKLLEPNEFERDTHYMRFNTAALLRTDTQATMSTLNVAVTSTIMSPNEAREKLDMNPYDGGDTYQNPAITPGEATPSDLIEQPSSLSAKAVIETHLDHMLGVESKAVNRMLAEGADHDKLDKWYENWSERLGNAIESFGGNRLIAQKHCVANLKYLERNPSAFDLSGTAELLAQEIIDDRE